MKLYINREEFETLEQARNYFLNDIEGQERYYKIGDEHKYGVLDVTLDKTRNKFELTLYRKPTNE